MKTRKQQRTEWDVRHIDRHGDCVEVDHRSNQSDAESSARDAIDPASGIVAAVVEKHVRVAIIDETGHVVDDDYSSEYETKFTVGDVESLAAGGWVN